MLNDRYSSVPESYTTRYWRIDDAAAGPESYYWTLAYKGVQINGGMAYRLDDAIALIDHYRYRHIITTHFWDEEAGKWFLMQDLNIM